MYISTAFLAAFAGLVAAETHNLYAGFFFGTNLVRLEFDDAASTLTIAENITTPYTSGQKWIALDVCEAPLPDSGVCKSKNNTDLRVRYIVQEGEPLRSHDQWLPELQHRV